MQIWMGTCPSNLLCSAFLMLPFPVTKRNQYALIKQSNIFYKVARGWHCNILCTLIFVLGQNKSQLEIFSIVNGQATISL